MNPTLQKGQLLIALPALNDPNFLQTVVLLCNYGTEGALGVILNRPTAISASALIRNFPGMIGTKYIFEGGPIAKSGMLILCRGENKNGDSEIISDISLAKNVESLLAHDTKPYREARCYLGYAGWTPGQLEAEIQTGSWEILPAEASLIFDTAPTLLWPQMMQRLGPEYAFYATMPLNPSMN